MNYYEFLNYYQMKENNESWILFCKYREIADVKGENVAIQEFRIN